MSDNTTRLLGKKINRLVVNFCDPRYRNNYDVIKSD